MSLNYWNSLCLRCRSSLFRSKPVDHWPVFYPRRNSSQRASGFDWENPRKERPTAPRTPSLRGTFDWNNPHKTPPRWESRRRERSANAREAYVSPPELKLEEIPGYFESNVQDWTNDEDTRQRLLSFGIPKEDLQPLLDAFVTEVTSKSLSTPENFTKYDLGRFGQPLQLRESSSIVYCTIFYSWATEQSQRNTLIETYKVQQSTIDQMTALCTATDRRFLSEEFVLTRRLKRKVIMHIGPTNSGKTHHALRALAAAGVGVYAGPLRLLAHEIWERLNLGHIVPAGVEDGTFVNDDKALLETVPHLSAIKSLGNPEYARLTNMLTGEEQKIVSPLAKLKSCTVEMLGFNSEYDVAVVDEIQMITDPQRGSGWTSAVLGLAAAELHLCGEETAVPIVQELLKDTGDEIIIKRYERLTPLNIEKNSLEGDYSRVQKGDCIVTFNRSSIFDIKRAVENSTGLRCAVVYGRLPPEIRSEQATLFNDPNSGYDVLVGSDAIGMGLNLKIRRIIFDAVRKYSPGGESLLSVSQIKQIAGRAGRFGLHEEPGGFATTFHEADLSYLKDCVESPFKPLAFARITFDSDTFAKLLPILPPNSATSTVIHAHHFVGRLPPRVRYQDSDFELVKTYDFIDEFASTLSTRERVLHVNAPVAWRDPHLVAMIRTFLVQARDKMYVDLPAALKTTRFMDIMEYVEKAMKEGHIPRSNLQDLAVLESFHKSLVLYIWMTFRAPVLYPQYELACKLKARLERVLEWCLEGMSDTSYIRARRKEELGKLGKRPSLEGKSRPQILFKSRHEVKLAQVAQSGAKALTAAA